MAVDPDLEKILADGSFRRAIEVLEAEWSAAKLNLGPEMPETVRIQARYADVLRMAGDYEKALELFHDAILKMIPVPDLMLDEVADIKLSIANITYKKDINEATDLVEVAEQFIADMPMDDRKMALKKKVAETMLVLGRYESALVHFEELYMFKCKNGPHNFDSLSSHVDIASVYLEQGRLMKAMDILASVHEEANKMQPDHPCTLRAERYIADVCMNYGIPMIACKKYEEIARIQRAAAPRSLDTLTTLHKLALAHLEDGEPKKALEEIEKVYNIRKVETPWHPDTKKVEIDFMMMRLREGDISRATSLLLGALETKYECFDFELVVGIPRNIATFFRNLDEPGKAQKAIEIYDHLYQKQCRMARLGPLHPDTLLTKTNIAESYLHLGNLDEALRIFGEVLNTKIEVLGNDNMDCLDVRKHIAEIYFSQQRFHESFDHYCEVYRNERMYWGAYHDVTVETENIVDGFCLIEPESNLIRAISAGDLQGVARFFDAPEDIDIDAQDYYGCTALHAAVVAGHPKIVRLLLSKGASLYVKNKTRKIPRELSKKNDVRNIFNIIMQLFMDVKLGNRRDITEVLSFDDGEIINVLDEEGKTLLHWACQRGDLETVNLLLNKGADPRVQDKSGFTALDLAAKLNHAEIVEAMNSSLEQPNVRDLFVLRTSPRGGGSTEEHSSP